jgi:hypothetical protein
LIDIANPGKVFLDKENRTRRKRMSINTLYHSWSERIRQLFPGLRITQHRNLVWLLVGIFHSQSVHLSKAAGAIPGTAQQTSATRRLRRFLASKVIRVRRWYRPIAQHWLQVQADRVGEIRLILDGSKVGAAHQLLMVAIAFRHRSLPVAWTWVHHPRGHSSARVQLALLAYVRSLLPEGVPVLVVGDSEFGSVKVLRQLQDWQWQYVLRQKGNHRVQLPQQAHWQAFGETIEQMGQKRWWRQAKLTAQYAFSVNLLAVWQPGEKDPWLLATNLPSLAAALKGNGFDLESTHLHSFIRLSRLTLAVVLLYDWLATTGVQAIKAGLRRLVDRSDRRDLSIFQIGWRIINRRLVNQQSVSIRLCPFTLSKVSGS